MADSRTFSGVTAKFFCRIKELGRSEYDIVFDPPDGPAGTARARTPLGECLVEFVHDSTKVAIVLTLVKKPMLLPAEVLWRGLTETIERCREDMLTAPRVRTPARRRRSSNRSNGRQ